MATPDIGTTVSDAYSRGIDRLGAVAGATLVPAVVVGGIALVVAFVQQSMVDSDAVVQSIFSGGDLGLSDSEQAIYGLLSAVQQAATTIVMMGVLALVAGAFHRERRGGSFELPGVAKSLPATFAMVGKLMPKLAILVGLGVIGPLVSIISPGLGGFAAVVAGLVSIWLGIRWIYAPVVVGSGEATGDAAFERSEQVVTGSWWPTFGVFIVITLAIMVPVLVAGFILGAVLGAVSVALGAFVLFAFIIVAIAALYGSAMESAWAQVEGGHGAGPGPGTPGGDLGQQSPPTNPTPPADPPASSGPFV